MFDQRAQLPAFRERASSYLTQRLRELKADSRAIRVAYLRGELDEGEYIAINKSLNEVRREVAAALQQIKNEAPVLQAGVADCVQDAGTQYRLKVAY